MRQNTLSKKTLYQAFPLSPWGSRSSLWSCAEPLLGSSSYVHFPPTPQVTPTLYINIDAVQHDNLLQVELISARPPSCHHCMACCAPCQSRPGEVFMGQDENEIKESSENALFFMMNKECERLTFLIVENSLPRCGASCSPATR